MLTLRKNNKKMCIHTYSLSCHNRDPRKYTQNFWEEQTKKTTIKTTTTSQKRNFYHNQTQIQINERENAITTHVDSVTKTTTNIL